MFATSSTVAIMPSLALVAGTLVWAAWNDGRRFTIPNRASVLIALAYLPALAVLPLGEWLAGLATSLVLLILGAMLFARGLLGGGDVKLAAAIALWAGPAFLADFIVATSASGALLALLMLATPLPRLFGTGRPAGISDVPALSQPMPFGLALAVGGIWVVALRLASPV